MKKERASVAHRVMLLVCLALVSPDAGATGGASPPDDGCSAAAGVVQQAYVEGLWRQRDEAAVRAGFDPGFVLQVLEEGRLLSVSLAEWLDHLQLDGRLNAKPVEGDVELLDCSGSIATVKVELYEDGAHVYSDHFELYRFPDGWRIVAKIFHKHEEVE